MDRAVGGLSCEKGSSLVGDELSLTALHNAHNNADMKHSFLAVQEGFEISLKEEEHDQAESSFCACQGCGVMIKDRFLLKVLDCFWHESCLRCTLCSKFLTEFNTCYMKEGQIFCKDDHTQLFATKCAQCGLVLRPSDFVLRCYQKTYHADCFQCSYCTQSLKKGQYYVLIDNQIICQRDYNHIFANSQQHYLAAKSNGIDISQSYHNNSVSSSSQVPRYDLGQSRLNHQPHLAHSENPHHHHHGSSSKKIPKRPRTILNAHQRKAFKFAFDRGPKPSRKVREQLAKDTGLSVRVVQVWFQNQRAKMKKEHRKVDNVDKHHHSSSASITVSTDSDGKSAADDEMKSPMGSGSIKSDSSEMDGFDMEESDDRASIITDIGRLSANPHSTQVHNYGACEDAKSGLGERENVSENPIDSLYRMHNTYFFEN